MGGGKSHPSTIFSCLDKHRPSLFPLQSLKAPFLVGAVCVLLPCGCTTDDPAAEIPDNNTRTVTPDSTASKGSAAFAVAVDTAWADTLRQQY